jgi:uncharacterized protein YggE
MRILFPLVTFGVLCAVAASAQNIQINKDNRTIAITETDQAEGIADVAAITVGFVAYGKDQTQTYADSTKTSNAIMDALHELGIKPEAIESKTQNLSAIDEEDKLRFAQGIRFTFSQSWQVTVPAGKAADTIHAAVLAGGNQSGSIQWKLKNEEPLEAEAAAKAFAHAKQDAERMAKGLGSKLGSLVYASNQVPQQRFFGGMLNTESAVLSSRHANLKPLAISPEKISRSATVYAVFAIE